jgi:dephospho-CoA kinase
MLKVGLTGGYASGKSFVARHLESLGCRLIYADTLGHQVLMPDGEAYQPTLSRFGDEILNPDFTINRKKLASIVFNHPDVLKQLNHIVHPAVFRLEQQYLSEFSTQDPHAIAVIEAAILIETGRYKDMDRLLVTSCQRETQVRRAMARDHITREEAHARLARQLPDAERVRFAHYVVHTDGTQEDTIQQVNAIFHELKKLASIPPI